MNDFGEFEPCQGRLALRRAGSGHALLGVARFEDDGAGRFAVRVDLTPRGRQVVARGRTVRTDAFITGDIVDARRWTFLLRP